MSETICGANCNECQFVETCKGCTKTCGSPWGVKCLIASCAESRKIKTCKECTDNCALRKCIINQINNLHIQDLPLIDTLYALKGSYINMEYDINHKKYKFLNDNEIYLGNHIEMESGECFGIVANNEDILVVKYEKNTGKINLLMFEKRN